MALTVERRMLTSRPPSPQVEADVGPRFIGDLRHDDWTPTSQADVTALLPRQAVPPTNVL